MKTFREIFKWDSVGDDRKVLFTEGNWYLYLLNDRSLYFAHGCVATRGGGGQSTSEIQNRTVCNSCGSVIPDSIKTLAIIHKWER